MNTGLAIALPLTGSLINTGFSFLKEAALLMSPIGWMMKNIYFTAIKFVKILYCFTDLIGV